MRPSVRATLFLGLALACAGCVTPSSMPRPRPAPAAPAALAARIDALGRSFDGRVGIAVEDVQDGWLAAYDGDAFYPQQSVGKLWVALTVFDVAERGRLSLTDPVLVTRRDMSVFNQPILKLLTDQGYATTIDGLLVLALAQSDNAASDILLDRVGGARSVRRALKDRRLDGVRAGPSERVLESRIAAVRWKPEYSFDRAFWTARDAVPMQRRVRALDAYLAAPADGATPWALADGLSRLQRGELLAPASSARFLEILGRTETGPLRLRAGLGPGWSIAHKTGTGQDLGDLATGYNDVGLITAPDGRAYAVVVMIASTRRPIPERQALMAAVTQAVVGLHDGEVVTSSPDAAVGSAAGSTAGPPDPARP